MTYKYINNRDKFHKQNAETITESQVQQRIHQIVTFTASPSMSMGFAMTDSADHVWNMRTQKAD